MINIVICGTPGTGKSTLIERVRPKLEGFNFFNLSKFALENDCASGYDKELETHELDEDKLIELLKPKLKEGQQRNVIECIHGDTLPSEMVDLVFVCRTDNTKLYDRLQAREYNEQKISNNMEAEIFQIILDEVRESFGADETTNIIELVNNELGDLNKNAEVIMDRIRDRLAIGDGPKSNNKAADK